MILIGRYRSPFVRRVGVSLNLLGIAFERKDLSTATDREAILAYNPLGRVPALVLDDGEVLIDSTPILDHLDQTAGPARALVPAAGPERRRALKLVAFAVGAMEKAVAAFYERERRPAEKMHQPWKEHLEGQVMAALEQLDKTATGQWLCGERIGQADVSAVCALDFVRRDVPSIKLDGRLPRLAALAERCEALPAFEMARA